MVLALPRKQADVTSEWLSEVLGTEVERIDVRTIAEGSGFMGRLAVVSLTYAPGSRGPASVVVKLPTDEPGGVALGQMLRLWEKEARFYLELSPTLPCRTPKCYWAGGDPGSGIYGLVLEDLSAFTNGDQIAGASAEQATAAIDWLSKFHGAESGGGRAAKLDWVPSTASDPMFMGLQPMLEAVWPTFVANLGDQAPPGILEIIEASIPQLTTSLQTELLPTTLVHLDFRVDNLFFDGTEVVAIDWQSVATGQGLYDVAYFMAGSVPVELRQEAERDLLNRYRQALAHHGVAVPGSEEFFAMYRRTMLYTCGVGALLLGQLDFTVNERAELFARSMAERIFNAADQLKVGDFLND